MSHFLQAMHNYLLREWQSNPLNPRNEYSGFQKTNPDKATDYEPMQLEEVIERMKFMRKIAPTSFYKIFPEFGPRKSAVNGKSNADR